MNLRLDSEVIRFRLSETEAKNILEFGSSVHQLVFPNNGMIIKIKLVSSGEGVVLKRNSENEIEMNLLENRLKELIEGKEREISAGNIRFEIDLFTREKRRKK